MCPDWHVTCVAPLRKSGMHILQWILRTQHFTLDTALFAPHTSHFTLQFFFLSFLTSHFALHTPCFTLHSLHSTHHSFHCSLQTPHFIFLLAFFTLHTSSLRKEAFTHIKLSHSKHLHTKPLLTHTQKYFVHRGALTHYYKTHCGNETTPQPHPPHRRGNFHRRVQPLFTEKNKVLSSQNMAHATFMQQSQYDLQPQSQEPHRITRTGTTTHCKARRRNQSRPGRTHKATFIVACSHLTRKKTMFRPPAFFPKYNPCNIHAAIAMRFATRRPSRTA